MDPMMDVESRIDLVISTVTFEGPTLSYRRTWKSTCQNSMRNRIANHGNIYYRYGVHSMTGRLCRRRLEDFSASRTKKRVLMKVKRCPMELDRSKKVNDPSCPRLLRGCPRLLRSCPRLLSGCTLEWKFSKSEPPTLVSHFRAHAHSQVECETFRDQTDQ
ncbi:hypothetical protein CROQUDRAFT_459225 [Cronartium quercuum f. sp. fusiforme G11]|uniref:Uncharacterized protein n=1 Tax=Cronartium quercuum f. sp. fusiforme G11 TaxID=708437 RepID=A0A9P6NNV9_9BASI|nr:hypothetical protein CROQUDRAFT_459225 [Cronartium quercuum f. sp. fusiforme G11]